MKEKKVIYHEFSEKYRYDIIKYLNQQYGWMPCMMTSNLSWSFKSVAILISFPFVSGESHSPPVSSSSSVKIRFQYLLLYNVEQH